MDPDIIRMREVLAILDQKYDVPESNGATLPSSGLRISSPDEPPQGQILFEISSTFRKALETKKMASSKSSSASSSSARTPSTSSVLSGDSNAASEERRLPRVFSITEPQCFITIIVGEGGEAKQFDLHKDVLCSDSPFFDSAFNGKEKFKEGEAQPIYLEDAEHGGFGLFFFWLYSGGTILQRKVGRKKEDTLTQTPTQLAKLWVLAKRFKMPKFQNAVINKIFLRYRSLVRDIDSLQFTGETHVQLMTPFIEYAYETNIAMLRDLAVNRLAFGCSESVFMDLVDSLLSDIAADIAKVLRAGNRMRAEIFILRRIDLEDSHMMFVIV